MDYFERIKSIYNLASIGRGIRVHLQPMIKEKLSRPILRALTKLRRTPSTSPKAKTPPYENGR